MLFRLLDLSDFHFGPCAHWFDEKDPDWAGHQLARELKDILLQGVTDEETTIHFDAVLLAGDFPFSGRHHKPYTPEEAYRSTIAFVHALVELGIVDEALWKLIVLPGNHDICRAERETDDIFSRRLAEQKYRTFLADLFTKDPQRNTSHLGYCHILPARVPHQERPIIIFSLNSCRIETEYTKGLGWVGYDQLHSLITQQIPERIKEWQAATGGGRPRDPICIAALHHHLHMTDPLPPSSFAAPGRQKLSFLTDAPEVLDALIDLGFTLILHGHAHSDRRYLYGQHPWRGHSQAREVSTVVIAGTGSVLLCGSNHPPKRQQFQVVEIDQDKILINSYHCDVGKPGGGRSWSPPIGFEFPHDPELDDTFLEAWQLRLRPEARIRAQYELGRFNACIDFEALLNDAGTFRDKVFREVLYIAHGIDVEGTPGGVEVVVEARHRFDNWLADVAKAPQPIRNALHEWLADNATGRLASFLETAKVLG